MVFLLTVATDAHTEDMVATDVATTARGRLRLLLRLRLLTDTVDFPMDVLTEAMDVPMVFLLTVATDAHTEDMVATDVATTARGRLRLLLRLRLLADTDTDTDFLMEATDVHTEATDFLMVATDALSEDMVATDVATMARGRLRLLLRLRLLTDTAMVAAMEAMEATATPMEDMVATG